ncbi:MAG: chemotaxis protein CheA [Bacteroidetes bacterium]|nr:chemotaxis protein CheA [Bacteroidota bacterium]
MIDAHRKAFIEEATELLAQLEVSLLELENNPKDSEVIAKVFRSLHTIKGSSGMFGYDDIAMFTHDIENVYDHVRNGEINITKELIDLTLAAGDQISFMLVKSEDASQLDDNLTKEILTSFRNIIADYNSRNNKTNEIKTAKPAGHSFAASKPVKTFLIYFQPFQDIFLSGTNPVNLIKELKDLGDSIILADFNSIESLDIINPEDCGVSWEIILKTNKGIDAIKDVFIFIEDQCVLKIAETDELKKLKDEKSFTDFKNLLFETSKIQKTSITELLEKYQHNETPAEIKINKKENPISKESPESNRESETASSIRVSSDKLDELVNLVGELVTVQARLSQIAAKTNDPTINLVSEEVERLTWSLRESALNTRMLPIGTTFSKFKRLVRDLSKELGKEVQIITEGAETELDKTIIEKLNDPLVHIIRNCVDHGIESPQIREKAGKSKTGTVKLSASQSGGNVLVEISDDGAGMNKDVIKAKAVKMGLINEKDELSDSQIYALVFSSGFSTAAQVTNVSGRGVGMDVVKRAIESLRGVIEVKSSQTTGTTITLKLPLTLAIIDGLLVRIDDDNFVLPLSTIEECIELNKKEITNSHEMNVINVRGKIIPYINLRERFGITAKRPDIQQIVVADIKGNKTGFVVDQVLGQHQTVLKSLGHFYKDVKGISGATIMGDGTIALILDINDITSNEEIHERNMLEQLSIK